MTECENCKRLEAKLAEANMNASGWRDQCSLLEQILFDHSIDYDTELTVLKEGRRAQEASHD